MLVVLGSAAFGQVTIAHEGHAVYMNHDVTFNVAVGENSAELIQKVRSALNLSDAQANGLQTLVTIRQQTIEQIMTSADDAHRKLEELMKQPNPNPTDLGAAILAVRSIHDGIEAAQEKFRTDFKGLLTAEQRNTLDKLNTASDQIHVLEQSGILQDARPVPMTMPLLSGVGPGVAIGIHGARSNDH
jgi:Spy/CpxP family protein refolding chaperone